MATQIYAYCIECNELNYAIPDKNGVYGRSSLASNHYGHRQIVFHRDPIEYIGPVAMVLMKLYANQDFTNNDMVMFKLALELAKDKDGNISEKDLLRKK